jgi:hypothetical protein
MVLVERPEENDHLEYLGIDGRLLLKWILSGMCRYRHDFCGSCECVDGPACCIKWGGISSLAEDC